MKRQRVVVDRDRPLGHGEVPFLFDRVKKDVFLMKVPAHIMKELREMKNVAHEVVVGEADDGFLAAVKAMYATPPATNPSGPAPVPRPPAPGAAPGAKPDPAPGITFDFPTVNKDKFPGRATVAPPMLGVKNAPYMVAITERGKMEPAPAPVGPNPMPHRANETFLKVSDILCSPALIGEVLLQCSREQYAEFLMNRDAAYVKKPPAAAAAAAGGSTGAAARANGGAGAGGREPSKAQSGSAADDAGLQIIASLGPLGVEARIGEDAIVDIKRQKKNAKDAAEIRNLIFEAFQTKDKWKKVELEARVNTTGESFIAVLKEIAVSINNGPDKGFWELKPEYKLGGGADS